MVSLEHSGKEAQKLGAEPRMETARFSSPDAQQTGRRFAAEGQPQQRLRPHQPGAAAEQSGIPRHVRLQQRRAILAEQPLDRARLEQPNAGKRQPCRMRRGALDPDRHDIDVEQHRKVRRCDLQQRFSAARRENRNRRLVNPALARADCRGWSRSGCGARR